MKASLVTLLAAALVAAGVSWSIARQVVSRTAASASEETQAEQEAVIEVPTDEQLRSDLMDFAIPKGEEADAVAAEALDDEISGMSAEDTTAFIEQADALLRRDRDPKAELLFGLGRVALLHEEFAIARNYLSKAAAKDYAPAYAYLADPKLSASDEEQWTNYMRAEELGYKVARSWRTVLEEKAYAAIERFTGDPLDPQLPPGKFGMSNARIMALDSVDIDTLAQNYGFFAKVKGSPAYLAFGIGRAAFLHQRNEMAREYLGLAMERGSGAACYYLAYPELTGDLDKRVALLQKAVAAQYKPAERALKDVLELRQRISAK